MVDRLLLALAGLCGLLGVGLSAAAAHGGGDTLRTAAQFLLFHAPLVVGLAGLAAAGLTHGLLTRLAGTAILAGLALFSGDLALRALGGRPLLPMAAPTGGFMLMAGWLLVGVAALVPVRRRDHGAWAASAGSKHAHAQATASIEPQFDTQPR